MTDFIKSYNTFNDFYDDVFSEIEDNARLCHPSLGTVPSSQNEATQSSGKIAETVPAPPVNDLSDEEAAEAEPELVKDALQAELEYYKTCNL